MPWLRLARSGPRGQPAPKSECLSFLCHGAIPAGPPLPHFANPSQEVAWHHLGQLKKGSPERRIAATIRLDDVRLELLESP